MDRSDHAGSIWYADDVTEVCGQLPVDLQSECVHDPVRIDRGPDIPLGILSQQNAVPLIPGVRLVSDTTGRESTPEIIDCLVDPSGYARVTDVVYLPGSEPVTVSASQYCERVEGLKIFGSAEEVSDGDGIRIGDGLGGLSPEDWETWRNVAQQLPVYSTVPLVGMGGLEKAGLKDELWASVAISSSTSDEIFSAIRAGRSVFHGRGILRLQANVYDVTGQFVGTHGSLILSNVIDPVVRVVVEYQEFADEPLDSDLGLYVAAFSANHSRLNLNVASAAALGPDTCNGKCVIDIAFAHDYQEDMYYGFWVAPKSVWDSSPEELYTWTYVAIGNSIRFCASTGCGWNE